MGRTCHQLRTSGHTNAEAGHTDVAEEGQQVDEEVDGEVDGGHVDGEGEGSQGSVVVLQLRVAALHRASFPLVTPVAGSVAWLCGGEWGSIWIALHNF